jgi:DNA-binding MarR family transcriptional regulator
VWRSDLVGDYDIVKSLHNEKTSLATSDGVDVRVALERLFELAILTTDVMEGGLAERGLTRARAEVLWRLHRQGPMTRRELSEAMRCTPRNVTGLVDALERDGYVTRGRHPTDRRATIVTLTERGAKVAGGCTPTTSREQPRSWMASPPPISPGSSRPPTI